MKRKNINGFSGFTILFLFCTAALASSVQGESFSWCGSDGRFSPPPQSMLPQVQISPAVVQPASTWTEGQKHLIFIRVDFSDLTGIPFPDSTGTNLVVGLNTFYTECSYGLTSFALLGGGSALTPTFRMPQRADYYGTNNFYNQLRTDARAAAAGAGFVLANYEFDLICFGAAPGWSWSGMGFVGIPGVWLRNSFNPGVAAHELGHNYGLNHANTWDTSG